MSTATPPIEPHAGTDPNALGALDQKARTALQLSPGETDAIGAKFTPSLTTPWLTGAMAVTSTRLVYRIPNTVLGFIPAGAQSNTVPISSIAAVSTNTRLRLGSIILGIILLIVGLACFGSAPVVGILAFLLGIVNFLVAFPASLAIQNNAGGIQAITVSMLEKARLEAFAQEVNNRVFRRPRPAASRAVARPEPNANTPSAADADAASATNAAATADAADADAAATANADATTTDAGGPGPVTDATTTALPAVMP